MTRRHKLLAEGFSLLLDRFYQNQNLLFVDVVVDETEVLIDSSPSDKEIVVTRDGFSSFLDEVRRANPDCTQWDILSEGIKLLLGEFNTTQASEVTIILRSDHVCLKETSRRPPIPTEYLGIYSQHYESFKDAFE